MLSVNVCSVNIKFPPICIVPVLSDVFAFAVLFLMRAYIYKKLTIKFGLITNVSLPPRVGPNCRMSYCISLGYIFMNWFEVRVVGVEREGVYFEKKKIGTLEWFRLHTSSNTNKWI
jgi:hypothetical protein